MIIENTRVGVHVAGSHVRALRRAQSVYTPLYGAFAVTRVYVSARACRTDGTCHTPPAQTVDRMRRAGEDRKRT